MRERHVVLHIPSSQCLQKWFALPTRCSAHMHPYKFVPNWLDEKNELKSFKSCKVDADQLNKKLLHLPPVTENQVEGNRGHERIFIFSFMATLVTVKYSN